MRAIPLRQEPERQAAGSERGLRVGTETVAALQRALLPADLPVLPKVRIAARYLAAGGSQATGGDWFDAITLPGGGVALLAGDVVGHGVAAAAAMGQLRAVLDDLLVAERDLSTVLSRADAFAARTAALRAATLALAQLSQEDGTLRYVTCGHPPPLVIGTDGDPRYLPATGSGPLGTGSTAVPGTAVLRPGELLLLYTDGLIRRPDVTAADCLHDLLRAAAGAAAGLRTRSADQTPADRVCRGVVELMSRGGYADDVAILAAQLLGEPVPGLRLTVPAEVASVPRVRRAFAQWLNEIDVAATDGHDLLLAVVETLTNAVEHAYPPGRPGAVEFSAVFCDDGNLECRVADQGSWRVPDLAAEHRGHGLMVAGQVVDHMRLSHAEPPAGAEPGSRGTVVTLRHRLRRPVEITADARAGPHDLLPAGSAYSLDIDSSGAAPRARVSGPVDGGAAGRLAKQLLTACRGGTLPITVDLTGVSSLASAGVRALYEVREQVSAHNQALTIVAAAGSSAHALLNLARLPHVSR